MDETVISKGGVYRETRFRQPGAFERACGLWVDRIGSSVDRGMPNGFRVLGQYAVVGVESGSGVLESPGRGEWRVEAGDAMLLVPDHPARYHPVGEWTTRWIVWNGPEADKLVRQGFVDTVVSLVKGAESAVHRTYASLDGIMDREDRLAALERKIAVLRLVVELARNRASAETAGKGRRATMEWVVERILRSPGEPFDVRTLARACRLSEAQFRRVFVRFTGQSPLEFVTAKRLEHAKALLARGLPIKQVAEASGYPDPCYFMRVFRRVTGATAGAFVRENPVRSP